MVFMRGYKLLKGTIVYYFNGQTVIRSEIHCNSQKELGLNDFYWVDELWATKLAIEFWNAHPHHHPNSTLFEILNKKLGI